MKKIFKIKNMHCTSCPIVIEFALEDIGVKAKGSYQRGEIEVNYDVARFTDKVILEAIIKAGYEVG